MRFLIFVVLGPMLGTALQVLIRLVANPKVAMSDMSEPIFMLAVIMFAIAHLIANLVSLPASFIKGPVSVRMLACAILAMVAAFALTQSGPPFYQKDIAVLILPAGVVAAISCWLDTWLRVRLFPLTTAKSRDHREGSGEARG